MASIDTGGGHGKKSVDQEIPLVPFIDLLLCCVMFLLVTAVWNQLAHLDANQQVPGQASDETPPEEQEERIKLYLGVRTTGFVLADSAGSSTEIPKNGEDYDVATLVTKLQERREMDANRSDIIVTPENGVAYEDVIHAMDAAYGQGFNEVSLGDPSVLQ